MKKGQKRSGKTEFYTDAEGKWRWRVTAPNGRVLCDSGESYSRKIDAMTARQTVVEEAKNWAVYGI